jgi:hypothetical protein
LVLAELARTAASDMPAVRARGTPMIEAAALAALAAAPKIV